jgi:hypothetical protein
MALAPIGMPAVVARFRLITGCIMTGEEEDM